MIEHTADGIGDPAFDCHRFEDAVARKCLRIVYVKYKGDEQGKRQGKYRQEVEQAALGCFRSRDASGQLYDPIFSMD